MKVRRWPGRGAHTLQQGSLSGTGPLVVDMATAGTKLTLQGGTSGTGGMTVVNGTASAVNFGGVPPGTTTLRSGTTLELVTAAITYTSPTAVAGAGTVTVPNIGTGTNATVINATWAGFSGTLDVGSAAASGAGRVTVLSALPSTMNCVIRQHATLFVGTTSVTHNATATLNGGTIGESYGQLRMEGSSTWTGNISVLGAVASPGGHIGGLTSAATLSGQFSGTVGLSKAGTNTVTLTNLASFTNLTGGIIVRGGTLTCNLGTPAAGVNTYFNSNTVTINTGATLSIVSGTTANAVTWNNTFTFNGGTLSLTESTPTLSSVTQMTTGTINVATSGRVCTLSATLTSASGLTKSGAGILLVSGANSTFSGGWTLSAGVLRLGHAAALGTGQLTISAAATIDASTTLTLSTNPAVSQGGNLTFTGTAALTMGTGTWTLTASRNITCQSATNALTIPGVVAGVGFGITKLSGGILVLSNTANTYSGGTTLTAGTLTASLGTAAGSKANFGSGAITAASGTTLRFFAGSTANAMSHANNLTINGGTLVSEDATQTFSGTVTLGATSTVNVVWSGKNCILSGVISGATFGITKTGPGTLFLNNAANTYTGATTVSSGPLGGSGTLASAITVASGASIMGGTGAGNAGTLTTTSTLTLSTGATLTVNVGSTTTCSRIAVTGALTLNGNAVNFQNANMSAGTYTLFTCGSVTGTLVAGTLPIGVTGMSFTYNATSVTVTLT